MVQYTPLIPIIKNNNLSSAHRAILVEKGNATDALGLESWQLDEINATYEGKPDIYIAKSSGQTLFVLQMDTKKDTPEYMKVEAARKLGNQLYSELTKHNITAVSLSKQTEKCYLLPIAEGLVLGAYKFQPYLSKKKTEKLTQIEIACGSISEAEVAELNSVLEANYIARDLVNEPVITLNSIVLSQQIAEVGKRAGFEVTVLHKAEIEKEGFGGLLAVNYGSVIPPTFSIMEYKPSGAKNQKPYVLVGKGLVFDTGGLSLKPTSGSMDSMKSDMGGSAAVIGAMYAIAKNKLPIYVIGLIPSTDNRPGGNAYVPGDIITLHGGKTVEVLNTDAEGRLILGDALSYAKKYDPELCIDIATLTGAQVTAIGSLGAAIMGSASEAEKKNLIDSGNESYERVAELPFWDEYADKIKSDIADLKNVGGSEGACITAGKFLEAFTDYPWIHIDIAGPSFLNAKSSYIPKGGTGFGVRLLYHFLKNKAK